MKIAHVFPHFFHENNIDTIQNIGGAERYVFNLGKFMAKKVDTEILTFGEKRETLYFGDLVVKFYPAVRFLKFLNGNSDPIPISLEFFDNLKKADTIHLHQSKADTSLLAGIYAKLKYKKIFLTDYGWNGATLARFFSPTRFVNGILGLTNFSFMNHKPRVKIYKVIYAGVDEKKFRPITKKIDRKIIFVGRVLSHKGIEYLIDSVDSSIKLNIIGPILDLKYFDFLKKKCEGKNVNFINRLPDDKLIKEYSSAIATVLPSVYKDMYGKFHPRPELFGLVLIESMACETPVIATDVGGISEVVENCKTGFVIRPNDPKELGEKINILVENPNLTNEMGREGRKLVLKKFTWEKTVERCLDTYENI